MLWMRICPRPTAFLFCNSSIGGGTLLLKLLPLPTGYGTKQLTMRPATVEHMRVLALASLLLRIKDLCLKELIRNTAALNAFHYFNSSFGICALTLCRFQV